jgi:hypothetical protein
MGRFVVKVHLFLKMLLQVIFVSAQIFVFFVANELGANQNVAASITNR